MPARKAASKAVTSKALRVKSKTPLLSAMVITEDTLGREPEAFAESKTKMLKSPSQKSVSTDEGSSSSSDSSSSPVASDLSPCSLQPSDRLATPGLCPTPRNLPERICNPCAPVWVDNGLTGDEAAWLLVMPKVPVPRGEGTDGSASFPKSPKDAVLLGPYVTTKNTFLDETRIGEAMDVRQRPRAKSMGASR